MGVALKKDRKLPASMGHVGKARTCRKILARGPCHGVVPEPVVPALPVGKARPVDGVLFKRPGHWVVTDRLRAAPRGSVNRVHPQACPLPHREPVGLRIAIQGLTLLAIEDNPISRVKGAAPVVLPIRANHPDGDLLSPQKHLKARRISGYVKAPSLKIAVAQPVEAVLAQADLDPVL